MRGTASLSCDGRFVLALAGRSIMAFRSRTQKPGHYIDAEEGLMIKVERARAAELNGTYC